MFYDFFFSFFSYLCQTSYFLSICCCHPNLKDVIQSFIIILSTIPLNFSFKCCTLYHTLKNTVHVVKQGSMNDCHKSIKNLADFFYQQQFFLQHYIRLAFMTKCIKCLCVTLFRGGGGKGLWNIL